MLSVLAFTGCASPTVLEGSTVTVATSAAMFSLNDRTSYGNSPANSGVLQAVNSSFTRYDESSALVDDPSFGAYQLLSNDPLTVKYSIAADATWSDGVPVDAADLMLAWVANSGALNTADVDDTDFRDPETGQYAKSFPEDVVYFDGTTSEGLQFATKVPTISDDGLSLTVTWESYIIDWPLLLQVGVPAHVVASKALGIPLSPDDTDGGQADPDRLIEARAAKDALVAAIRNNDVAALSKIANFWNSGFNLDAMPDDDSLLVSTGPYTVTGFVPGESVTLGANGRYRGEHSPVFETVKVRFLPEPLDQVAALADGAADVIVPRPSPEILDAVAEVTDATAVRVPGSTYEHLDLTFAGGKHSTFQDIRVREAFLRTVPTQEIRAEVIGNPLAENSERESLAFSPGSPGYTEAVTANGSSQYARPDVEGAISLLAEAGATAPKVCMMFDPSNPKRVKEFQLIADSAALAGFVVQNCSGPDWMNLLGTPGSYDASLFAWSSSNTSVAGLQSIFADDGRGNLNGYTNPVVETLLSELAVTPDPDEQRALRTKLDTALYSDRYGLPLYQDQIVVAHNGTIAGIAPGPLTRGILWNIWEWAPAPESTATPSPVK